MVTINELPVLVTVKLLYKLKCTVELKEVSLFCPTFTKALPSIECHLVNKSCI